MHEVHAPRLTRADALPRLADRGVEAVDERNRGLAVRRGGCGHEQLRSRGVHGERLLADHVLAGREGRRCERFVKVIRRADVHHVEFRVLHELLGRGGGTLGAEGHRGRLAALGRGGGDCHHAGAGQAGGAGVNGADEAGPGDSHSKLLRGHRRQPTLT